MEKILEKLSSYQVINYIFCGFIVCYLSKYFPSYNLLSDDVLINLLLFYFSGLVVSRVGSLLIEPLLLKIKFIKYAKNL